MFETRSQISPLQRLAHLRATASPAGEREPPSPSGGGPSDADGDDVQTWVPGPGRHRSESSRDVVRTLIRLPRRMLGAAAAALVVAVVVAVAMLARGGPEPSAASAAQTLPAARSGDPPAPSSVVRTGGKLVVSVVGKVRKPGLVEVAAGARVADAVAAAGGPKRGVDLTSVNLARQVADGEQIHVGVPALPGSPGPAAGESGTAGSGPVNLNSATAEALEELPGVGPVTAGNILDWRTRHGRFTAVEQLREVDGIGERRLAALRDKVTV